MSNDNVICLKDRNFSRDAIRELIRNGARQLLAQALKHEVEEILSQYVGQFAENGHQTVVRSGYQCEQDIQTSIGPVLVRILKVRSNTGESYRSILH